MFKVKKQMEDISKMANKQDLIAEVAAKTGLTKKKIQKKQLMLLVKL